MMDGIEPMTKLGVYANNVETLVFRNVMVEGQDGDALILQNVDRMVE